MSKALRDHWRHKRNVKHRAKRKRKAPRPLHLRVMSEDEIRAMLEASVPAAEELDRRLEPLFRLGPERANLVLDKSR